MNNVKLCSGLIYSIYINMYSNLGLELYEKCRELNKHSQNVYNIVVFLMRRESIAILPSIQF